MIKRFNFIFLIILGVFIIFSAPKITFAQHCSFAEPCSAPLVCEYNYCVQPTVPPATGLCNEPDGYGSIYICPTPMVCNQNHYCVDPTATPIPKTTNSTATPVPQRGNTGGTSGGTSGSGCSGSLSHTCGNGGCPNNRLSAQWDVSDVYGGCNVYIRGNGIPDTVINGGKCGSGNWSATSFGDKCVTNDGIYELIVSNGVTGVCLNKVVDTETLTCTQTCNITNQTPAVPALCVTCLTEKSPTLVNDIQKNSPEFKQCTPQQMVNFWCNGGLGAEGGADCTTRKNSACQTECGGDPNACSLGQQSLTPDLGKDCGACVVKEAPGAVQYIKDNAKPVSCSDTQIANFWCNGGVSAQGAIDCNSIKSDTNKCLNKCNGSSATCSLGQLSISPDLGQECGNCIVSKESGAIQYIKDNAKPTGCSDTQIANYWCNGGVGNEGMNNCNNSKSSANKCLASCKGETPQVQAKTIAYKISESELNCTSDPSNTSDPDAYLPYTKNPLTIPYSFKDTSYGVKKINVCFKYLDLTDNKTKYSEMYSRTIRFAPPPITASATCSFSLTGEGTTIKIEGFNFGAQSSDAKVETSKGDAEIISWTDQLIPPQTATESGATVIAPASSKSTVIAKLSEKVTGNLPIKVITADGRETSSSCNPGISSLYFNAKVFCLPPEKYGADNVDLKVINLSNTSDEPINKKISIDQNGQPQGIDATFSKGSRYGVIIKAPKSLAKRIEFNASEGTQVLGDIILPVGDISPLDSTDGIINALDAAELHQEWSLITDVTRVGDFNLDNRVNSIDWSCMRHFFNQTDEK